MTPALFFTKYKSAIFFIVFFLVAVPVGLGGWKYMKSEKLEATLAKADAELKPDEIKDLMSLIGRHVVLPEGEEPTVATVQNVEKLQNQPFFAKAINGDKVLIFHKAEKAFLYRQSIDKVLDIAPLQIPTPTGVVAGASTGSIAASLTVTIINASKDEKTLENLISAIKSVNPSAQVRTVATTKTYEKSIISDLTGKWRDATIELAEELELPLESFPGIETRPATDAVIILAPAAQVNLAAPRQRQVIITPQATPESTRPSPSLQPNL